MGISYFGAENHHRNLFAVQSQMTSARPARRPPSSYEFGRPEPPSGVADSARASASAGAAGRQQHAAWVPPGVVGRLQRQARS